MTREEFYEKYGDVKVRFSHYYKFTFTFAAVLPDGNKLTCDFGGNANDIYRYDVDATVEVSIASLEPYAGSVFRDGKEVEGFYDYI